MNIGYHLNTAYKIKTSKGYISKEKDIFKSIELPIKDKIPIIQILISNPRENKDKRRLRLLKLGQKLKKNKIKVVLHSCMMYNFCNEIVSHGYKSAVWFLCNDMVDNNIIGGLGVVVHMGKRKDMNEDKAIKIYVSGIKECLKKTPGNIILETGAGCGTEICTSLEKLGELRQMFSNQERKRIKFCIDTCHIYSYMYDIGYPKFSQHMDAHISRTLGWNNVALIHLNDSKEPLCSQKDRHADIGTGYINIDGLIEFVKICESHKIPMVLETRQEANTSDIKKYSDLIKDDGIYTYNKQIEYLNIVANILL